MVVNSATAAGSMNTTATTNKQKGIVGKDDFLLLLVAQLKNQDPLSPMKDNEFMAQMAQFSSLEQLQNLGQQTTVNQAFALLGKEVAAQVGDTTIQGIVGKVWLAEGEPYLLVGEYAVRLAEVIQVGESSNSEPPPHDEGGDEGEQQD